jgi:hypothetical protein
MSIVLHKIKCGFHWKEIKASLLCLNCDELLILRNDPCCILFQHNKVLNKISFLLSFLLDDMGKEIDNTLALFLILLNLFQHCLN